MAILKGFLTGLAMVIFVGPVFFTLLKVTMQHGRLSGIMLASGILVSDLVIVVLCIMGFSSLVTIPEAQLAMAFGGAVILTLLGLKYILHQGKPAIEVNQQKSKLGIHIWSFSKGFLVNFVNPFVFGVWIAVLTFGVEAFGRETDLYFFLGAALVGIFFTDFTKVMIASRLTRWLTPIRLRSLYRLLGFLLIIFATRLVWFGFQHLYYL